MFSEMGDDFDGFDELSVARIRPYYNLTDLIDQVKASIDFYYIIPERSRDDYDQLENGSGGLTESEKEFICRDENYSNKTSESNDDDKIPFTIAFYRSYYIDCDEYRNKDPIENIPVRIEFSMFGQLNDEDWDELIQNYENDIFIPENMSVDDLRNPRENQYFTMVVRENDKGSFGIFDD